MRKARSARVQAEIYRAAVIISLGASTISRVFDGDTALSFWPTVSLVISLLGLGAAQFSIYFWTSQIALHERTSNARI